MRTILEKPTKDGKRRVVVELSEGEHLQCINADAHYKLMYPVDLVLNGEYLINPEKVVWCSLEQKWL